MFACPTCAYVGGQAQTLSVGQGQQLVVVQHRVEILHPLWVHIAVKDDPLALLQLPAHVVNDSERQSSGLGPRAGDAALHFRGGKIRA